ncbi:hypothetical protein [Anaerorhabdus sp.]|uniref:hypothetical protein n=1 Tax=Anaerorhabdus sp. TaxID=1872524 RepID=UPI002FC90C83
MARQKIWKDLPDESTPITSKDLQYYDDSINALEEENKQKDIDIQDLKTKDIEHDNKIVNIEKRLDIIEDYDMIGVRWVCDSEFNQQSNPVGQRFIQRNGLIEYDTKFTVNIGTDGQLVKNDFDNIEPWKSMKTVFDKYGNQFVRIPKCYIRHWYSTENNINYLNWAISMKPLDKFIVDQSFYNPITKGYNEQFYYASYPTSNAGDNTPQSKGNETIPWTSITRTNMRLFTKKLGTSYHLITMDNWNLINTLFVIEHATLNWQTKFKGVTELYSYTNKHRPVINEENTNRVILPNSQADTYSILQLFEIGTAQGSRNVARERKIISIEKYDDNNKQIIFDGTPVNVLTTYYAYGIFLPNGLTKKCVSSNSYNISNNGKNSFIYRGIENFFGNVWEFIDGINIRNYVPYVCDDYTKFNDVFVEPYFQLNMEVAKTEGYVKKMYLDEAKPHLKLPTLVGGSTVTYYSDYYYVSAGDKCALFSGAWNNGSDAGGFRLYLYGSLAYSGIDVGSRLSAQYLEVL